MAVELATIFLVGYAVYKTIEVKCDLLIKSTVRYGRKLRTSSPNNLYERWQNVRLNKFILRSEFEVDFVNHITSRYLTISDSITRFRRLALLMLLTSDILVIPAFSNTIYHFTLHPENFVEFLLKPVALSTGVLFFSRSYIVTALFSGIHTESKRFHTLLASILARKSLSPHLKLMTLEVMESVASEKNCMAIPQSGGRLVRQTDTLFNFLNTLQFVLLIFGFEKRI